MTIPDDERFRAYVVDRLVPFPRLLEASGYEGYLYEGKVYCIFHENYESPAAKIYHDSRGDTLWCFSEQKRYRPSDVYRKKLNRSGSISSVSESLWRQLDESVQQQLIDEYSKPVQSVPDGWNENQDKLSLFKKGKITFEQHLNLLKSF